MISMDEQTHEALRGALADYAHRAWSGWMAYLFRMSQEQADGSVVISPGLVARWRRQMQTGYAALPPEEQRSDLKEADEMLAIVRAHTEGDHA